MIKRKHIPFLKLFVTCTYLVGMFVSLLVHDHSEHVVSYQKADACERVIYYADKHSECHHAAHYTKVLEKCSLCDVHVFTPHDGIALFQFRFLSFQYSDTYSYVASVSHFQPFALPNKGPPSI